MRSLKALRGSRRTGRAAPCTWRTRGAFRCAESALRARAATSLEMAPRAMDAPQASFPCRARWAHGRARSARPGFSAPRPAARPCPAPEASRVQEAASPPRRAAGPAVRRPASAVRLRGRATAAALSAPRAAFARAARRRRFHASAPPCATQLDFRQTTSLATQLVLRGWYAPLRARAAPRGALTATSRWAANRTTGGWRRAPKGGRSRGSFLSRKAPLPPTTACA
jgi:hypothetical protein